MKRKLIAFSTLIVGMATASLAQDSRVEVSPFLGYTLSEGFTVDPNTVTGILVDKINPTSGLSYGFMFNVNVGENMQVGFL